MTEKSDVGAGESAARVQDAGGREVFQYAVRRFGVYLFTLWAAITVAFFVFRLVPGDPMNILLGNLTRAEGRQRDKEAEEAIIAYYREIFGMDDPLPLQYVNYLRTRRSWAGWTWGRLSSNTRRRRRTSSFGACPGRWVFLPHRCC